MNKKKIIRDITSFSAFSLVAFGAYLNFEPAVIDAATDDITVTQHVTSDLTISNPSNVTMTGTIYGMTGGTGDGSATWTVKTSDTSGFSMSLSADAANCLRNGVNHFNDYSIATPYNYSWTAPAVSAFGFTIEPATAADTDADFLDNGSNTCGTGSTNGASTCWSGFNSTTLIQVVNRTTQTTISGEAELVRFKSQLISGNMLPEGDYVATVTATATTN